MSIIEKYTVARSDGSSSTYERTLYTLAELEAADHPDPRAYQRAYQEWLEGVLHYDWWEFVFEDAARAAEILGIEIATKRGGPAIYFSGFCSQGDGACWEGSYAYAPGAHKKIREYAPTDKDLHAIADDLLAVQRRHGYGITATSVQRGHYSHSGCMSVDVDSERTELSGDDEDTVVQALRGFADWIYKRLEAEADCLQSEEQFREWASANDALFTEEGRLV